MNYPSQFSLTLTANKVGVYINGRETLFRTCKMSKIKTIASHT